MALNYLKVVEKEYFYEKQGRSTFSHWRNLQVWHTIRKEDVAQLFYSSKRLHVSVQYDVPEQSQTLQF